VTGKPNSLQEAEQYCAPGDGKCNFLHRATFTGAIDLDLRVTWVCVHDLTWHKNDLKVD